MSIEEFIQTEIKSLNADEMSAFLGLDNINWSIWLILILSGGLTIYALLRLGKSLQARKWGNRRTFRIVIGYGLMVVFTIIIFLLILLW